MLRRPEHPIDPVTFLVLDCCVSHTHLLPRKSCGPCHRHSYNERLENVVAQQGCVEVLHKLRSDCSTRVNVYIDVEHRPGTTAWGGQQPWCRGQRGETHEIRKCLPSCGVYIVRGQAAQLFNAT